MGGDRCKGLAPRHGRVARPRLEQRHAQLLIAHSLVQHHLFMLTLLDIVEFDILHMPWHGNVLCNPCGSTCSPPSPPAHVSNASRLHGIRQWLLCMLAEITNTHTDVASVCMSASLRRVSEAPIVALHQWLLAAGRLPNAQLEGARARARDQAAVAVVRVRVKARLHNAAQANQFVKFLGWACRMQA